MHIVRSEGLSGLYRGLSPAVARGLFYGGEMLDNKPLVHDAVWLPLMSVCSPPSFY